MTASTSAFSDFDLLGDEQSEAVELENFLPAIKEIAGEFLIPMDASLQESIAIISAFEEKCSVQAHFLKAKFVMDLISERLETPGGEGEEQEEIAELDLPAEEILNLTLFIGLSVL